MDHQPYFLASQPLSHEAGLVLQSCLIRSSRVFFLSYDGREMVTPFGLACILSPECTEAKPIQTALVEFYQRNSSIGDQNSVNF